MRVKSILFREEIPEGEGQRFSGRVNMVRVNEPWRSFTPFPDYLRVDFIRISSLFSLRYKHIYIYMLFVDPLCNIVYTGLNGKENRSE